MKRDYSTKWVSGMAFETEITGHKIVMDADDKFGGKDSGPRPKALIIAALTGCSGMDVVSILNKMRVKFDSFEMKVETELSEEHPKTYTKIHVIYEFSGENLEVDKLDKAASLSQDKYCGVAALLKKGLDLSYEIRIV